MHAAVSLAGGRSRFLETATAGFRPYLLLTLLCALLYLPGLATMPPLDRDEARFMQATKQMLETGDWVQIRFQDEPRNKKPVGIYWLQAVAVTASGVDDLTKTWPYRLPSALAAWLAVLATCHFGRRLFNPTIGLSAGAVLATSLIVIAEAHIAKTDAALLASTTIALGAMGLVYVERGSTLPLVLAFWLALGVGMLIKGPVIVLVVGATIAALCIADRNFRWPFALRPITGIPVVLIVVLPWLIAVSSGGNSGSFLDDAIRGDILPKLIGGQESHGAPPGVYLLSALATAWPWSALAPFVLAATWRERANPAVRFCIAWLIPAWIVFEIVPTKLPHYIMPLFPAFALLTAWSLMNVSDFPRWVGAKLGIAWRILWASLAIAMAVGVAYASGLYGDGSNTAATVTIIVIVGAGLFVLAAFSRTTPAMAGAGLTAAGTLLAASLSIGIIPSLRQMAISTRIAEVAAKHPTSVPVAIAGFAEPSAVFLLGTRTVITDLTAATDLAAANPGSLAVVPMDDLDKARARAAERGRRLIQIEEIPGYNYSRGVWLRLAIVTAETGE